MNKTWIALSLLALSACSRQPSTSTPVDAHAPKEAESSIAVEPVSPVGTRPTESPVPIPEADITTVITCTGATLKMGKLELWKKWVAESQRRYTVIYPEKNAQQIEDYTLERALDKRRSLEGKGIIAQRAFTDFYNKNCLGVLD